MQLSDNIFLKNRIVSFKKVIRFLFFVANIIFYDMYFDLFLRLSHLDPVVDNFII